MPFLFDLHPYYTIFWVYFQCNQSEGLVKPYPSLSFCPVPDVVPRGRHPESSPHPPRISARPSEDLAPRCVSTRNALPFEGGLLRASAQGTTLPHSASPTRPQICPTRRLCFGDVLAPRKRSGPAGGKNPATASIPAHLLQNGRTTPRKSASVQRPAGAGSSDQSTKAGFAASIAPQRERSQPDGQRIVCPAGRENRLIVYKAADSPCEAALFWGYPSTRRVLSPNRGQKSGHGVDFRADFGKQDALLP